MLQMAQAPQGNLRKILQNIDLFSRRFQKAMSETTEEREDSTNYYVSTFCLHLLLFCLYEGSNDLTRRELDEQLKIEEDNVIPETYARIVKFLKQGNEDINLYIPTKIYISDTYEINDNYTQILSTLLEVEVEPISFINNVTAAARINIWSQSFTANKIAELVEGSDFENRSRMVLVSSVCFQADWLYDFPAHKTETEPFTIATNQTVQVQMMTVVGHFDYIYSKILEAQVVRLPFRNQTFSMLIFLPNTRTGMCYLEKHLQTVHLHDLIQNMNEDPIRVKLPRFRIETKINAKEYLERVIITYILSYQIVFSRLCTIY